MATLNDVISCYNELVDEVNGHTASIDKLTASFASINTDDILKRIDAKTDLQTFTTAMASLTAKLSQLEARLDELVQEHDVMMDTISSLLAAPTPTATVEETVELKRVEKKGEKKTVSVEEAPTPAQTVEKPVELKRVEKKPAPTVVEEPTAPEEEKPVELKRTPTPAPVTKTAAKTKAVVDSAIQKRALARQYMVEHGAKVEDLRNPERINETIASDEFTAWMNAR